MVDIPEVEEVDEEEDSLERLMMASMLAGLLRRGGRRNSVARIRMGKNGTFFDLFEVFKQAPTDKFEIEFYDGEHIAVGDGVARQFYLKCIDQIIEIGAFRIEGRFMVLDPANGFWEDEGNIYCLVKLIGLILQDGILPYHLSPGLLRVIVGQPLADFELEFFLDKKDHQVLHQISQPGTDIIIIDELGFTSKSDYIEYVLDKNFHPKSPDIYSLTSSIYSNIGEMFKMTGLQYCTSAISLDERISGRYEITNDAVYRIMDLVTKEYEPLWKQFIYSLTETELKNMLLTFTNSLSMDFNIKIEVKDIQLDMNILTCMRVVTINRKLFIDGTLDSLKLSFTNNDAISDIKVVNGNLVPDVDPSVQVEPQEPAPINDNILQLEIPPFVMELLNEMLTRANENAE